MMVFWIENQGGFVWAVDLTGDTNEVFAGNVGDWKNTGLTLADFLLYATLEEAIFGSGAGVAIPSVPIKKTHRILREFTLFDLFSKADLDPATRLYVGADALVQTATPPAGHPTDQGNLMLRGAAVDGRALRLLTAEIEPEYLVWGPFDAHDRPWST